MQKVRLVLFSKFKMMRSALRLLLPPAEVDIIAETDSVQSLAQAMENLQPDVVLVETTEITNPVISSVAELTRQGETALVILANQADAGMVRSMFRAGVTGFVLKHSSESELLLAIHSAALGRRFLDASLLDEIALDKHIHLQTPSTREPLSQREFQVLGKLVQGYTSAEIARELKLTIKTIETYRARIYEKLNLHTRADLVRYAVAAGLISVHERRTG